MNNIEKLLSDFEWRVKISSFPTTARPGITGVGGWRGRGGHISKAAPAGGAAVLRRRRHGGGGGRQTGRAGPAGVWLLPAMWNFSSCRGEGGEGQGGLSPLRAEGAGLGLRPRPGLPSWIFRTRLALLQVGIANFPDLFAAFGSLQTGRLGAGLLRRFGGFLWLVLASFVDDHATSELLLLRESRWRRRRPDENISVNPGWKTGSLQGGWLWNAPNTHLVFWLFSLGEREDWVLAQIWQKYLKHFCKNIFISCLSIQSRQSLIEKSSLKQFYVKYFIASIDLIFIDITLALFLACTSITTIASYLFNTLTIYCRVSFKQRKFLALNHGEVRHPHIKSHHNKKVFFFSLIICLTFRFM